MSTERTLLSLAQEIAARDKWPYDCRAKKNIVYGVLVSSIRTRDPDAVAIQAIWDSLISAASEEFKAEQKRLSAVLGMGK